MRLNRFINKHRIISLLQKSIFSLVIILVFFAPSSALAVGYGEGTYGSGTYNEGDSGNLRLMNNSTSGDSCTAEPPSSKPDLFQVNTTDTTATLLFKLDKPYTSYLVMYGKDENTDTYGGSFNQSETSETITHTIDELSPNTKYYFKVQATNECAVGDWSNTLDAKTSSEKNETSKHYKNIFTKITDNIQGLFKKDSD